LGGLLLQGGDGFIDASGDEEFFGGLSGGVSGGGESQQKRGEKSQPQALKRSFIFAEWWHD
jgi:hypothetical protein